jgi:hypothetical protein
MGDHGTERPATLKQRWAIAEVLAQMMFDTPITFAEAEALLKTKTASRGIGADIFANAGINLSAKHPSAESLEQYFYEVYGYTLDLSGIEFPEKECFSTWMAVPPELSEDKIMECITRHFMVARYLWKSPITANIDLAKEQRRPSGLYVLAHRGGDESDDVHRNKSYDCATAKGFPFANLKEYLLMTGFHRFEKGHFMDNKGWTHTSSLWSEGFLVSGFGGGARGRLCIGDGDRDNASIDRGPRELFLGNFSL